ncbi:hypothetical protein DL96DRAFT_1463438 [Flagelloscypha sp. PMI_526]|nr:hypothetical protein DL96DRAFT_1463438 [Flagelloscypha sp. PMI_526]
MQILIRAASFQDRIKLFNGNVLSPSKVVVYPVDSQDVSDTVLFCTRHSLSLCVKSGGYGIAGWAVNGDVVIDMSRINGISVEPPGESGTFTSLKDESWTTFRPPETSVDDKAPQKLGKRRREDDDDNDATNLRDYSSASLVSHKFLGGEYEVPSFDSPSPAKVRRVATHAEMSRPVPGLAPPDVSVKSFAPSPSPSSLETSRSSSSNPGSSSAPATLPPPSIVQTTSQSISNSASSSSGDPFGYLNTGPTNFPPPLPAHLVQTLPPGLQASQSSSSPSNVAFARLRPELQALTAEPEHAYVYVSVGAGKRQKEIDIHMAKSPLPTKGTGDSRIPYHIPTSAHPVGSTTLITGGFGFLSRMYGLSIDNLVEVEMVLANGDIVVVNEKDHPDLFWAVRGAGPSFGIAVRYKAIAYPVPVVYAGNIIYRFNRATTPSLIKHFRDCVKSAPRQLYANVLLTAGPQGKYSLVVIQLCYLGMRQQGGQEWKDMICSWDGEPCLLDDVSEKSFLHQQDSVAQVLRGKAGRQWYIRSALVSSLPDDIIARTVNQFAGSPVGCTWLFELAGGAVAAPNPLSQERGVLPKRTESCFPNDQREAQWTIVALHQWDMGDDDPLCVEAGEEWIKGTLKPVRTGGSFPSFISRHESPEHIEATFGENWERLVKLKKASSFSYDPTNVFCNTFWPLNKAGEVVGPETHEPPSPTAGSEFLVEHETSKA